MARKPLNETEREQKRLFDEELRKHSLDALKNIWKIANSAMDAKVRLQANQTFEYALDAEYIDKSPYRVKVNKKKIIPTRKKPSEQEVYSQEEKTLLLAELERRLSNNPYHIVALAIMLEFELGTRRAEILAISNSDIKDDKVHICKQIVDEYDVSDLSKPKLTGYKVVDYTKTRDGDRYLPLTAKAKSIISRIQRINMETGESYKDFLFVQNGYLINPNKLYDLIKDACGCINIPIKATHRIRKTYASTLYNNGNGVDISTVKDMLGHADERTTISHYIFSTSDSKTRDEKVLDALQGNTTSSNKSSESVTNGDKNIIHFQEIKKRKTPSKLRVFH
ncbi:MAG: tyrosine-type recombinase/integrase [Dorea sp.]|nr:tyrosine-type recombinase/integrase [Dorea sp.]